MKAWNAHFDGKVIVLDEPAPLKPNAKVKVVPVDDNEALISDFQQVAEPAFNAIWDNSLDADYDKL